MDDDGPNAGIIFIILVLLNMFYYGFSVAKESVNVKEAERRAEEEKDKKAMRLLRILNEPKECDHVCSMIFLLVHVLMGYFCITEWIPKAERFFAGLLEPVSWKPPENVIRVVAGILVFVLVLYVVMIVGILVPKKLAKTYPEKWAYAGIPFISVLNAFLRPFIRLIHKSSYIVLLLFGINSNAKEVDVTEEEIIDMVNEGQEQGIIEASEAEMISNIFEYREKEAQDIMTQRNNIVALDGEMLLKDAIEEVLDGKQSRYPVYEENIDHIIGILHLKDAMRYHADHEKLHSPLRTLSDLLREPEFIPQTRNIDELFKEMQSKKLQMVIVIDEYGQTTGLVAMEDILEEIVGNIMDEYDEETEYIEEKGEDEYVIEGMTPLEELEERFEISFGEVEFETLNGFLIWKMDKIPDKDEQFEVAVEGYNFKILSVENKMIQSVLVTRLPDTDPDKTSDDSALEEKAEK